MEWFSTASEWLQINYPILLTMGASLLAVIGTVFAIWTQIKPILDKLNFIKDKVDNVEKEDVTSKLQLITLDTQITDLKAKIENPTVSDTLKQAYITQLAQLEVIKAKIDAGLVKVEDTASRY